MAGKTTGPRLSVARAIGVERDRFLYRLRVKLGSAVRLAGLVALVALLALVFVTGCGGGDSDDSGDAAAIDQTAAKADAASFPRVSHRSFRDLIQGMQQGPALAPAVMELTPGRNRFGFGLFDRGNRQIGDLEVVLYHAGGVDETAHGPYPARFEKIDVKPAYQSKTTSQDPDAAKSIYVANLPFRQSGSYLVSAVTRLNGQLIATSPAQVKVSRNSKVPQVGDAAISIHTPTKEDVGGKLEKIDTRVPPDDMHDVDFADALAAHKPVILQFATPALCESRVCGPVVDAAEQVHHDLGDKIDFVHMEVYTDNDLNKGMNKQMAAWHLSSEPFLFAINSEGKVVQRLEGAFSVAELEAAARRAMK